MDFNDWINQNAGLYRGNNASDCMKAAWDAATENKDAEIQRLSAELSVNATMLARQCDMAREAERELLVLQRNKEE
jgi:hypothetical protein